MPMAVFSEVTNSCWLISKYIPKTPKQTPIIDSFWNGFLSISLNINNTNKGCVDASKAAKPLSTNCNAQTKTLFPRIKKKKDAMAEFLNWLLVTLKLKPSTFEIINIKTPAVEKRKDAKKKAEVL